MKVIFTERDEALVLHYMMLTRQMTRLADCIQHILRLRTRDDSDGKLFKGYAAYAQSELSDVFAQGKKICEILGLSFEETVQLGILRDEEKRVEFLNRYPTESWV